MSVCCCNMRTNFGVRWASSGEEGVGEGVTVNSSFFVCFFVEASKRGCFFLKALIHCVKTQLAFHHSTRKPSANFPTTLWYGMVESRGWYYHNQGLRGFT